MCDYKYRALANAPLPDWGWELKDFRTEYLRPIAEAFKWNLVRSCTFAQFPAWLALEAIRERLWIDYATTKIGQRDIDPDLSNAILETNSESVATEFNRLVDEYISLSDKQLRKLLDSVGVEYVEYRLRITNQQSTRIGIDALFSTVVIDSWASKGDTLSLDGETVKKLRDSAMFLGRALIQFVDNILSPQSTPA